jgi:hypothetical protein
MALYALAIQQKVKEFFKFQKKIIRIVSGSESRTSCEPFIPLTAETDITLTVHIILN